MTVKHLTKAEVAALPMPEKPVIYYDERIKGFGLRLSPPSKKYPHGTRSWFVEYRPGDGGRGVAKRRMVIGDASKVSAADARKKAEELLALVELKGPKGDPARDRKQTRQALTVGELVRRYLDEEIAPKRKARTLELYEGYLVNHIAPRTNGGEGRAEVGSIGSKKAIHVMRSDIAKVHREIGATTRMTANRIVVLLAAAYTWGTRHAVLPEDHPNPARGITKYPEQSRERFLSADEVARLEETLKLAETTGLRWEHDPAKPKAKHAPKNRQLVYDRWIIAAIRLLLYTGCRRGEILTLKWEHVDLERGLLLLPDSKTGKKRVILSEPAIAIFEELQRADEAFTFPSGRKKQPVLPQDRARKRKMALGEYVIVSTHKSKPRSVPKHLWDRIRTHAGLEGLRIHDLRHNFASFGISSGANLPVIGRLMGHKNPSTTQRYAHLADDAARRAVNAIGASIKAASDRPTRKAPP